MLLEDDSADEQRGQSGSGVTTAGEARLRGRKRRRLYKSESEAPPPPNIHYHHHHPHQPSLAVAPIAKPEPRAAGTALPRPHINISAYHGHIHHHQHSSSSNHSHVVEGRVAPQFVANNILVRRSSAEPIRASMGGRGGGGAVYRGQRAELQQKGMSPAAVARGGRRRASAPSPMYSPLVVGGESYNLASPSVRLARGGRERNQFSRFHVTTG